MPDSTALQQKARNFEARADKAQDTISRQQYKEMARHYRILSVEHLEALRPEPVR